MGLRQVFLLFILFSGCGSLIASTTVPDVIVKKTKQDSARFSSKIMITQQEMAAMGATSLSQALQTLGGVQLHDTSGNGSQVLLSMRGFGANASSNTLLMINGIPLTNPDIAPPDLNGIPIQEIEHVEIFAGSESVLYGDQAVGGFINVVTRREAKKNASISCSLGSYNQHNCYAGLNNNYQQLNYAININTNHSDNYRDHNNYDQNLLSGRLYYPYQTGSIEFDYRIANERMLYPGALTAEQVEDNRRQANNDTDFFKDWNGFYHIRQQQVLNANWSLETDLARREMNGSGVLFSPFNQSRVIHFIKPQLKGTIGDTVLSSGLDFEYDQYELNTDFGITDDSLQKYGIYSLVSIPATSSAVLSIGARAAQQNSQLVSGVDSDTMNRAIAATLSTTLTFSPNITGYLRRAGSFRFPKADENASTSPGINGLKTQQGVAYETGIEWSLPNSNTKFSLYQLNLKDEIAFDPNQTPQDPFGTNRNLDPTVRRGFAISEKYQMTEKVTLSGQYNFVNARFQSGINAGNRIPLVSENNIHVGLNYEFVEYWNLYTEAIYTGNQFAANDDANITKPNGGYAVCNFNVRYQYHAFTAAFRLNNVFNKLYNFYSVFQPGVDTESFYPAPGRNFQFTLKYLFE